jgi:hypothetical protein
MTRRIVILALGVLLLKVGGCSLLTDPNAPVEWVPVATYPSPIAQSEFRAVESELAKMIVEKNIPYVAFGKKKRTFCVPRQHASQARKLISEWVAQTSRMVQVVYPIATP